MAEQGRGQVPGRCGTCKHFPGNAKDCSKLKYLVGHVQVVNMKRYANDYGDKTCENYSKVIYIP